MGVSGRLLPAASRIDAQGGTIYPSLAFPTPILGCHGGGRAARDQINHLGNKTLQIKGVCGSSSSSGLEAGVMPKPIQTAAPPRSGSRTGLRQVGVPSCNAWARGRCRKQRSIPA